MLKKQKKQQIVLRYLTRWLALFQFPVRICVCILNDACCVIYTSRSNLFCTVPINVPQLDGQRTQIANAFRQINDNELASHPACRPYYLSQHTGYLYSLASCWRSVLVPIKVFLSICTSQQLYLYLNSQYSLMNFQCLFFMFFFHIFEISCMRNLDLKF